MIDRNEWPDFLNHPKWQFEDIDDDKTESVLITKDQYNLARKCVLSHEDLIAELERTKKIAEDRLVDVDVFQNIYRINAELVELCEEMIKIIDFEDIGAVNKFREKLNKLK